MIRFHALGGLTVTVEGDEVPLGGARQRRLLAVLLIHRNAVVSADRLADAVFAGQPTPAAGATLRSYVARMRRVLEAAGSGPLLVTRAPGYLLRLPDDVFDVACFERLVASSGSLLARQDPAGASAQLREALGMWRGDAYAEFADEDWARPEVQRLAELRLVAQERLFEAELACGRAAEVVPQLDSLIDEHPLREAFRAQQMIALYRVGRQAEALQVFRDYRALLVEELGVEPTPGLTALERRLLTQDPTLTPAEPAGLPLRGYLLGERLGTGRDGTVYAARLPGVDRDFAVRIIRKEVADHPEFVRTFEAGAQRVAALRHPAIVPIHDYWREPGAAYLVARRMHGGSLADRLTRGTLPVRTVAALVGRVGGALVAAAERGIVHGRVVPESVLFDAAGDAYLGDFCVAPLESSSAGDDVSDLASLVRHCLGHEHGRVGQLLGRAAGTVGRPPMAEFVPALVAALTGSEPAHGAALPNPYKGLRAFDEADADDFYGRKDLVDQLVTRLARDDLRGRLVLVVGGSGTGKSSVVRAGLLPRVRRGDIPGSQHWYLTTMLPGSAPFKELAECLRRVAVEETTDLAQRLAQDETAVDRVLRDLIPGDGQLLLVVDQLEELFTLAGTQDQRAFLDGLMFAVSAPDSRLRVVATLRADFYDRPLGFSSLGPHVGDATVPMVPMSPTDLEAAVVEPVARIGGRVDPGLVAELVRAVVDEAAALPSLQYTLYELAERDSDLHLGLAGYRQLGGVDGAIASRAERLFSSLDDRERAAVRGLFERLVVVGPEGEPTRRRAARTELSGSGSDPTVDAVIDRWAQARLLTLDRHPQSRVPTVELAHEAMIREWPRLRGWIEEDREAILTLGRIRDAAAAWVDLGRDPDALYRGARLEIALDAAGGRPSELPEPEREFLEAGREAHDRARREAAQRSAAQSRDIRRLRTQRIAIALALVVAVVGGAIAMDQRQQAEQERRIASARELAAGAEASLTADPDRSILLALAAVERTRGQEEGVLPGALEALHAAVAGSRAVLNVPGVGGSLAWSPDGSVFVTEGPEESGMVDIRDAETGESVLAFRGHQDDVNDVAFSSDGAMLATSGDDGAVRVWDTANGDAVLAVQYPRGRRTVEDVPVWVPSLSPDGKLVAGAWPRSVRVIDVETGDVVVEFPALDPSSTAFSPDGSRLAFGTWSDRKVTVVDVATGRRRYSLVRGNNGVLDVEWSPDGRWLATAGDAAEVWDGDTGRHRFTVTGHTSGVWDVAWSPDSKRLATASGDGTAQVAEITASGPRRLFSVSAEEASSGGFNGVAFSPDGDRLMTGDLSITSVKVWDASPAGGGEWLNTRGPADFAPDGRLVVGRGPDVAVLDSETGERQARVRLRWPRVRHHVWRMDASDDGSLLATQDWNGVTVWDAVTGRRHFTLAEDGFPVDFAWSPDSEFLAVAMDAGEGDESGHTVVVDRSGDEVARLPEPPGQNPQSVSFGPDGDLLATTRSGMEVVDPGKMPVTVWDVERAEVAMVIEASAETVAFSPAGDLIVTSRITEGVAEVWDARSGRRLATLTAAAVVGDIAFTPDGETLATGHADGSIRLWSPATGDQRLVLRGDESRVEMITFTRDGTKLASMNGEGSVRVWALDLADLIALAEERLTRTFSTEECRQYLHAESCPAWATPAVASGP